MSCVVLGRRRGDALRCHFAAVGQWEAEQVCGPVIELRADKLYLLRQAVNDEGQEARELVRDRLRREAKEKGNNATDVEEINVDMRDPAAIAHEVGTVVEADPGMNYRFNTTTGPREVATAAALACMFWDVTPYVVFVDTERRTERPEEGMFPYAGYRNVPRFPQPRPKSAALDALDWLASRGGRATQRELIAELSSRGHIRSRTRRDLSPQARQGQFRSIVEPLVRLDFLSVATETGPVWALTDEGRVGLVLFRGRLADGPRPGVDRGDAGRRQAP